MWGFNKNSKNSQSAGQNDMCEVRYLIWRLVRAKLIVSGRSVERRRNSRRTVSATHIAVGDVLKQTVTHSNKMREGGDQSGMHSTYNPAFPRARGTHMVPVTQPIHRPPGPFTVLVDHGLRIINPPSSSITSMSLTMALQISPITKSHTRVRYILRASISSNRSR